MIATTERGIYVTHFGQMEIDDDDTLSEGGDDARWLVANRARQRSVHSIKKFLGQPISL